MDTSDYYIKMCFAAKGDLDKYWKREEDGDFFVNGYQVWEQVDSDTRKRRLELKEVLVIKKGLCSIQKRELAVWLPRQDQLQSLLDDDHYFDHNFIKRIEDFIMVWQDICTWEQFWLTVFMAEKEDKEWNNFEECWEEVENAAWWLKDKKD